MSLTLRQLSPRQRDALRSALASLLERHFTFPAYFDYRRNALAHRPVDGGKRLEIIRYIQQTPLELDIPLDSAAMERWVAQTLLGFANANPSFTASRVPSLRHTLVRRARQAVADVTQYAGSGLLRDPPAPFPTEQSRTWLGALNSRMRPDAIAQHERQTQMIALVLARPRPPAPSGVAQPAFERAQREPERQGSPGALAHADGAPGGLFGFGRRKAQPQSVADVSSVARPREAPSDLLQLYGEYLSDMQPEMTTHETAAIPRTSAVHGASAGALSNAGDAQTDMQLFYQLRFQIEGYVRKAASSYGLPDVPGDPSHVIEALRGSNLVDESDLRMAEGILALTDRVIAEGAASVHDYRQALMLYLLYHRSHLT